MTSSSYHDSFEKKNNELTFEHDKEQRKRKQVDESALDVPRFLFRLGRQPIPLELIEYRIIRFLASKPYKAFRRHDIIQAVHSTEHPVSDANLDEYIRSLRSKLGLFSDYIQTVPYVGYRFKP